MSSAARTTLEAAGVLAGAAIILGLPIAFWGAPGGLVIAGILIVAAFVAVKR